MTITLPIASHWQKILNPALARLTGPVHGWFYTIQANGDLAVSLVTLILLGFALGLLGGLFGGASGFLMAPALNIVGNIPYNVAVGTELSLLVGTATVANLRHRGLGSVDYKLGLLLFLGGGLGLGIGVQLLKFLTYAGEISLWSQKISLVQLIMSLIFGGLLAWIGRQAYREARRVPGVESFSAGPAPPPISAVFRLQELTLPPRVSLPRSGVEAVSLWLILGVGAVSGLLTGLLGVKSSFILLPALVYLLGIPMFISLGTNLFEYLILALFGALIHSMEGNVELILMIILLVTAIPGSQCGV
ncbi:MAG: sulfite exporter TauE/SafE family protein [Deltaproteobacteria bacterium]